MSMGAQGGPRTQPTPREEGGSPKAPHCRSFLRVWRIICSLCRDVRGLRLGRYGPNVGSLPVLGVWHLALTTETSSFCFLNFYCKALCRIAQLGLTSQSSGSITAQSARYKRGFDEGFLSFPLPLPPLLSTLLLALGKLTCLALLAMGHSGVLQQAQRQPVLLRLSVIVCCE